MGLLGNIYLETITVRDIPLAIVQCYVEGFLSWNPGTQKRTICRVISVRHTIEPAEE